MEKLIFLQTKTEAPNASVCCLKSVLVTKIDLVKNGKRFFITLNRVDNSENSQNNEENGTDSENNENDHIGNAGLKIACVVGVS